jgi:hypothetical protein
MLEPLASPRAPTSKEASASRDIVVNAIPPCAIGELAKPAYPPEALAAHAGKCVVYVTITIDAKGDVTEVLRSWQRLTLPNKCSGQFFAAVEGAVRSWRFVPARNVYWQKVGDNDLKYLSAETIPAQTDIKFTFEASGGVR